MFKQRTLASTQLTSSEDGTTSEVVNLRYIYNYTYHIQVTDASDTSGPPSVKLQGSNDKVNWQDISGTSNNITSTGAILINRVDDGFKYSRAIFSTGGTDDITVTILVTGRENRV